MRRKKGGNFIMPLVTNISAGRVVVGENEFVFDSFPDPSYEQNIPDDRWVALYKEFMALIDAGQITALGWYGTSGTSGTSGIDGTSGTSGSLYVYSGGDVDFDVDEEHDTTLTGVYGMLLVKISTDGVLGIFRIEDTATPVVISANALFSVTKDNALTYNVYYNAGTYKIQNKVGDDKNMSWGLIEL